MRTIGIPLILLMIASCSDRKPPILAEDFFAEIYSQQVFVQEESKILGIDSAGLERRIDSLYRAHQVTSRQVQDAITEYQADLPGWRHIQDLVARKLEAMQDTLHTKAAF